MYVIQIARKVCALCHALEGICQIFSVEVCALGATYPLEHSPQILVVSPLLKAKRLPIVLLSDCSVYRTGARGAASRACTAHATRAPSTSSDLLRTVHGGR